MSENKIKIPIGENFLVVEAYQADKDFPVEITVYLMDKNNTILQDICLVREHYDIENANISLNKNLIDCLVWGSSDSEDYSNKFKINIREDD